MPPTTLRPKSLLGKRNRARFLTALLECGTVSEAARVAAVDRPSVYRTMTANPDFKEAVSEARDVGIEALKDKAYTRASDKSDVLLMFLIKQADPTYRESYRAPEDEEAKVSLRDVMNAIRPEPSGG